MASAIRRAPDRRFVRIHASPANGPITMTASTKASPAGPRFTPAYVCAEPCTKVTAAWSRTTMTSPMSVLFPFISLIDDCETNILPPYRVFRGNKSGAPVYGRQPVRAHRLPLTPQRRIEQHVFPHAVLKEILALLSLEGQVHLLREAERRAVLLVDQRVEPVRLQLLEHECGDVGPDRACAALAADVRPHAQADTNPTVLPARDGQPDDREDLPAFQIHTGQVIPSPGNLLRVRRRPVDEHMRFVERLRRPPHEPRHGLVLTARNQGLGVVRSELPQPGELSLDRDGVDRR